MADQAETLGWNIVDDGFYGNTWVNTGLALLDYLNMDLGRLDAGTLDSLIRTILEDHGAEVDR